MDPTRQYRDYIAKADAIWVPVVGLSGRKILVRITKSEARQHIPHMVTGELSLFIESGLTVLRAH